MKPSLRQRKPEDEEAQQILKDADPFKPIARPVSFRNRRKRRFLQRYTNFLGILIGIGLLLLILIMMWEFSPTHPSSAGVYYGIMAFSIVALAFLLILINSMMTSPST